MDSTTVRRATAWLLVGLLLVAAIGAPIAAAADRKLGTIGRPPRQNPQRETGGESLPPLPLPATPLRRSEPKAEPSPPLFVGKLMYGDTQDYMPNPGDVDNLLRHVRYNVDAWYGWQLISIDEITAMYAKGGKCHLPMLYITGYHPFELTAEQRQTLRRYLLDGGTLVGDATLGSGAFADSFRAEVAAMFPERRLAVLQPDHPILRSFYQAHNVEYFAIGKGAHSKVQGPPVLEGLNLAARTAVILSPYDMTCGWDEFYAPPAEVKVAAAPRTKATMPQDAIRLGINIVTYVSAQRRFGKVQAETRAIVGNQTQRRAAMPIALLRHAGDWNADPNSLYQLIRLAAQQTSLPVEFDLRPADVQLDQIADTPVVIMTGMDDPQLADAQVDVLRRHVQAGGFLFINNTSGFNLFDREVRQLVKRLFPDQALEPVPADHALLHGLYELAAARDAATGAERPIELEAVFVNGRAAVVYSPTDTLAMLKGIHDPYANAYDADSSRKLALNILSYAVRR